MATFNYQRSRATAKRLLTKFGQDMTFSLPDREEGGAPGVPGTTIPGRSISGKGVILDYSNGEIDGTVIQSGDSRVILEATDGEPAVGMIATINGRNWRIMDWSPLAPAGTTVINTIQLRRV